MCYIPLESDFSLILLHLCLLRLCRPLFIPLLKQNALWELVNETRFRGVLLILALKEDLGVDFGLYSIE